VAHHHAPVRESDDEQSVRCTYIIKVGASRIGPAWAGSRYEQALVVVERAFDREIHAGKLRMLRVQDRIAFLAKDSITTIDMELRFSGGWFASMISTGGLSAENLLKLRKE
jgi:hypothetical protein